MSLIPHLERVLRRESLPARDARLAMSIILEGGASTVQIAAFLVALRMKGESGEEVLGFAQAMREKCLRVNPGLEGASLIDTCGTGGDGAGTFNISTVAAFVVAGTGAKVAKHGNRSISSRCGSADIMEGLGVRIALAPEQIGRAIREVGIGFLFAPVLHPAMKYAQPARIELKVRTVFNILGPLTNPAGATAQLIGAPNAEAAALMAEALAALGLRRGFVVHGSDGLDEITTTGTTLVFEIAEGRVRRTEVGPEQFGVKVASGADLKGGDLQTNCEIAWAVLGGAAGPQRDIVVVNASAALVASGCAADLPEGAAMAARAIDSGTAAGKVEELARFTQQFV